MTVSLRPYSYDGVVSAEEGGWCHAHIVNDGELWGPVPYEQPVQEPYGAHPIPLAPQPKARTFQITLQLNDWMRDRDIMLVQQTFSGAKGERPLIFLDPGGVQWVVGASVTECIPVENAFTWQVSFQATDPDLITVVETSTIDTYTGNDSTVIPLTGNRPTPLIIDVTATAPKGAAYGYQYRRKIIVANRSPNTLQNYPITINVNGAALAAGGFMSPSGDDLRVFVDGHEVDRWLGDINQVTSNVWINLDLSPRRYAKLIYGITPSSPATGGVLQVKDPEGDLPEAGVIYLPSGGEAIYYASKTQLAPDTWQLGNITRGIRATNITAHSPGESAYWVEHQIDIVYGWTNAGAPPSDPTKAPLLALGVNASSNAVWTITDFGSTSGKRPIEWHAERQIPELTHWQAWRGHIQLAYAYPTGNGSFVSGNPGGAPTQWQCVDDPVGAEDYGGTYISHVGFGEKMTFVTSGIPTIPQGSFVGVELVMTVMGHGSGLGAPTYSTVDFNPWAKINGQETIWVSMSGPWPISTPDVWSTAAFFGWTNQLTQRPLSAGDLTNFEFGYQVFAAPTRELRVSGVRINVYWISDDDSGYISLIRNTDEMAGHGWADTWMMPVPVGATGVYTASIYGYATVRNEGNRLGYPDTPTSLSLIGVDSEGVTRVISAIGDISYLTPYQSIVMNGNAPTPLYAIGLQINQEDPAMQEETAMVGAQVDTVVLQLYEYPIVFSAGAENAYHYWWEIVNTRTGEVLDFSWISSVGDVISINCEAGTATVVSKPWERPIAGLTTSSPDKWIHLEPGDNLIQFVEANVSSGSIQFKYRRRARRG
jgi:hypothetical protein